MRRQVRISGQAAARMVEMMAMGGNEFELLKREAEKSVASLEVPTVSFNVSRGDFTPAQEAFQRASQYSDQGKWLLAIQALSRLIKLKPSPTVLYGAHLNLGVAYFRVGNLNAATEAFRSATNFNGDETANLFLGTMLLLSRRFDEALDPLRKAIEQGGHTSHANFYLGYVYGELGRWDEAIAAYNAEIEHHPRSVIAYDYLSKLYFKLAETQEVRRESHLRNAIETFEEWTKFDPRNWQAFNLKGYLHSELKEFEAAISAYERAVELKPDYIIALSNLGAAYLNVERDQDAKRVLERVVTLGVNVMREQMAQASQNLDADVCTGMDEAFQMLGAACLRFYLTAAKAEDGTNRALLDQAQEAFETALKYNLNDIHALYNLGYVYYLKHLRVAAARMYRRVLELEPSHEEAAHNLHGVEEELEKRRKWLEATVGKRAQQSTPESPVHTEDLMETLADARARLYEGVDPALEDEAFSPEDLLSAMLPVATWMSDSGAPEARFDFAARIFGRGWLSSGKAARLAAVDRAFFLTNIHRVGVAVLDLDEEEMENEARYVNAE